MEKSSSEKLQEDQQLLDRLLAEGSEVLEQLYASYRPDFIAFASKYRVREEDILDVYQDAIIAFFENVSAGKVTKLSSTIKTYLFSIGKNKLMDLLKSYGKKVDIDLSQTEELVGPIVEEKLELTDRQQELRAAINELGGQCRELLILFYYRRFSIEAIQKELEYKNENTVKANKSRCMKSLRAIIKKRGHLD